MSLSKEEIMVLGIFKEFDIEKKRFLPFQILHQKRQGLPQQIQANWKKHLKGLENLGYVIYDPLGYGLTDKGFACIRRFDFP